MAALRFPWVATLGAILAASAAVGLRFCHTDDPAAPPPQAVQAQAALDATTTQDSREEQSHEANIRASQVQGQAAVRVAPGAALLVAPGVDAAWRAGILSMRESVRRDGPQPAPGGDHPPEHPAGSAPGGGPLVPGGSRP